MRPLPSITSRRAPSPRGDAVLLLHDEHVGLAVELVENLGLAARDFVSFTHRSSSPPDRRCRECAAASRARALGRVADVAARVEPLANFGRIDPARDPLVVGEQRRERVRIAARASASYARIALSRITSCSSWRSPPRLAASIRIASVPANGPYVRRFSTMRRSSTRSPSTILRASDDDLVGAQQRFGQDRAAVRAVVERALEQVRRRVLPRDVGVRRAAAARANRCVRPSRGCA